MKTISLTSIMAHVVDDGAEGTEGTGTGIAKAAVDINQWLKTNRLSKLKGYFEAEEMEMEDLYLSSEKELELRFVYNPWTEK